MKFIELFSNYLFQVASAIEELITQHQKVPGNILRALFERFYNPLRRNKKNT